MSDVVDFKRSEPPVQPPTIPTLEDHFGEDAWLLKICANWRAQRAQIQRNWAEHELATGWGTFPSAHVELDDKPLAAMKQSEWHLSEVKPRTVLLARELLGMCLTILAHENEEPDSILAEGPVIQIMRNVISSLNFLDAETRLGPRAPASAAE